MAGPIAYPWKLICHAFWAWWEWVVGDTFTAIVAMIGTAVVSALLLPWIANYAPFLRRFAGEDTMDSVINAGGLAIFFAVVCFAFFLIRAPYQLHRELEGKVATLEKDLEDASDKLQASLPNIKARIVQQMVGENNGQPFVFLVVRVVNNGAPSIADAWVLTADIDGKEVYGLSMRSFDGMTIPYENGEKMHYGPGELLFQKTVAAPIPTGGLIAGVLVFEFRGVSCDRLIEIAERKGFRLTFIDSQERLMEVPYGEGGGPSSEPRLFPGLTETVPAKNQSP